MHRVDTSGATDDNRFTDGDPTAGIAATMVDADFMNAIQEEIVAIIEAAGITLNKESTTQLKDALEIMLAQWTPSATTAVAGLLKIATEALALAGVDDSIAMTPALVKAVVDACRASDEDMESGTSTTKFPNVAQLVAALNAMSIDYHFVGQWVSLRNSEPPTGYYVRNGALIENASTAVPKLWAYLQEEANQEQCITQTEWTAMQAATYTLSDDDETEVAIWDGVGGVPYYVLDTEADTLRLPDTRGMYAEDAGFDEFAVGASHGDMIRNISGTVSARASSTVAVLQYSTGVFSISEVGSYHGANGTKISSLYSDLSFSPSRVVPTGNANKPRGYGMLGCIYAG